MRTSSARGVSLVVASAAAVAALGSVVVAWRIALPAGRSTGQRLGDLHVYTGAIEHLHRTGSLYTHVTDNGLGFTYPPVSATLFAPLTWASADLTDTLWTLAMLAASVVCAAVVAHRVTPLSAPRTIRYAVLAACVVVLLQSAQVQSWLVSGNVSVLLTALCLVDVGEVVPRRLRGILVGVASAVKLTPLIFVPYFLLTRQRGALWRALAAVVGLTALGWVIHPQDSVTYWTDKILETERIGDLAFLGNQSAMGVLARVEVEGAAGTLGWLVIGGAVGLAGLWRAREAHRSGDPVGAAVVLGCASVIASPVSWPFHQIWLPLAGLLLMSHGRGRALLGLVVVVTSVAWPATAALGAAVPGGQVVADNWQFLLCLVVVAAGFGRTDQERPNVRRTPARAGQATSGTNFFHG